MHYPSITLVVPCYNEEMRLDTDAFLKWVLGGPARHLCFVNDASTDQTAKVLDRLCERHSRISVLHLPHNHGKAGAVRAGIIQVTGCDLVGFWDADLATPLDEVDDLIDVLVNDPKLHCVAEIRVMRLGARIERSFARHVLSRLFVTVASFLLGLLAYDTQCGAKLFRNEIAQPLFSDTFISPWLFDIELYLRLRKLYPHTPLTKQVCEHALRQWTAVGRSNVKWRDFAKVPFQLHQIYRRYR